MNNNVFHSATIRGQLFEASMIYEGPRISLITPRSAVHDGVHLGVCNIVQFDPTSYRCHGFGWYIVKYRSEARVFLRGSLLTMPVPYRMSSGSSCWTTGAGTVERFLSQQGLGGIESLGEIASENCEALCSWY